MIKDPQLALHRCISTYLLKRHANSEYAHGVCAQKAAKLTVTTETSIRSVDAVLPTLQKQWTVFTLHKMDPITAVCGSRCSGSVVCKVALVNKIIEYVI